MFLFEQRAVQDHGVAPLFRTCPGTKEATSKARQQQQPQPSRTPPTMGVYVACVPASVRHACLFRCRLLQRGLGRYMTLCACSCRACLCLCCMRARACPGTCHGDKGDGWNSRSRSSRSLQLVEAGPRALTPDRFPLLGGCRPRGSPRLWGAVHASSNDSFESSLDGRGAFPQALVTSTSPAA